MASEEELKQARAAHARALRDAGTEPFPNDFRATEEQLRRRRELVELAHDEARRAELPVEDEADGEPYPLFGRIVAKRGPFLVIRTPHGDAQALVRPERLPETDRAQHAQLDLADHAFVEGPPMRTRTGAAAVRATCYRHLAKATLPPPAKWHGFKDVEKRYRERYVDLFSNPDVAEVFRARTLVLKELRTFLDERDFLEVETPLLHQARGGASARPFVTHHNALDLDLYLRIAPELYLKRLLVGGLERVYELGRTFRNEGISTRHNPEFTILEFYMAYAGYEDLIAPTQDMLRRVDARLRERHPGLVTERTFDLDTDFARVTMRGAVVDRLEAERRDELERTPWSEVLDETTLYDADTLARACERARPGLPEAQAEHLDKCTSYGERVYALFEMLVEPVLTRLYRTADGTRSRPVFVTEFPVEISPLARKSNQEPGWVDRFELFLDGREVVNAFSELNDPDDQAERFRAQLAARESGDEEAMDFDADYIRALEHGMPPAAGFGLGVDRLVMTLCGCASIRDVLLFPLLRPEGG